MNTWRNTMPDMDIDICDLNMYNISNDPKGQYRIQRFQKTTTSLNDDDDGVWRGRLHSPNGTMVCGADLAYIAKKVIENRYPVNQYNILYLIEMLKGGKSKLSFTDTILDFLKDKASKMNITSVRRGNDFLVLETSSHRQTKKMRKKLDKFAIGCKDYFPQSSTIKKINATCWTVAIYNAVPVSVGGAK